MLVGDGLGGAMGRSLDVSVDVSIAEYSRIAPELADSLGSLPPDCVYHRDNIVHELLMPLSSRSLSLNRLTMNLIKSLLGQ